MKASFFDYKCAATLAEASALLAGNGGDAKVIAGGQTLGPMLNLRLAQPALVVDVTRIPEMIEVKETKGEVIYGACVTHANFEDGRVPDPAGGFLARVAKGIAYRAVRTRGTIGGSIAHADPAADWISALLALDSEVDIHTDGGNRRVPLRQFFRGPLSPNLHTGDLLTAIRIQKPAAQDRFGYAKLCRKTGELAEAIGVVRRYSNGRKVRFVAGGGDRVPIVIDNGADFISSHQTGKEELSACLVERGLASDPYTQAIHITALQRALDESWSV
jgi:aerobic carbon-monoxide dehydrogenase medium subunit